MDRRNFLAFSMAMGFSGLALAATENSDGQPLKINVNLSEDTEHLQERFERFLSRGQSNSFSDLEGRLPLTFKVNILNGSNMQPLTDARVAIFLADAFKSCDKSPGCSNRLNAMWQDIPQIGSFIFESKFPSTVLKQGKFIRPVDFVLFHKNKISISRLDVINDFEDSSLGRKYELNTRTLTDLALQITEKKLNKPTAYLMPVMVNDKFESSIDFIVSNV